MWVVISLLFSPNIHAQTCSSGDAATSYSSNNGSRGAMFNITAGSNPVTIARFSANLYVGPATYEIYYRAGTYVGNESNAAAWTLVGSCTGLTGVPGQPTLIPINVNVTIPANTAYGFYVTNTTGGGLNYTSSATTNVSLFSNADLTITGGVGKSYPFASTFNFRLFNGTAHYYIGNIQHASLATTNSTHTNPAQSNSSSNIYAPSCSGLICTVTGSGANPISGPTTSRVWIQGTQPAHFVRRHYEITPVNNPTTATGRVTLYFTQADFDAFNAVNVVKLPLGPTDNVGKANLLVEKRNGTSSDGSGLPSTYSGGITNINPTDSDINWNATNSRWEVTFDVTGFSGFYVKTQSGVLPVRWLDVQGSMTSSTRVSIRWRVQEQRVQRYFIEGSLDGLNFTELGQVNSRGDGINQYLFDREPLPNGMQIFRIKQEDQDTRVSYSNIIRLRTKGTRSAVAPNPAKDQLTLHVAESQINTLVRINDQHGRTVKTFRIESVNQAVDIQSFAPGMYYLQLADGENMKWIKQ